MTEGRRYTLYERLVVVVEIRRLQTDTLILLSASGGKIQGSHFSTASDSASTIIAVATYVHKTTVVLIVVVWWLSHRTR